MHIFIGIIDIIGVIVILTPLNTAADESLKKDETMVLQYIYTFWTTTQSLTASIVQLICDGYCD